MLDNMLAFTRVIEKQGFAKAAHDLNISTPVITRRIHELETSLATKLIQRSTRKLSITEAGKIYYSHCKNILQSVETAHMAIKSLKNEVSGTIKIGIPTSINQLYFIPALHKFLKKYPGVHVEIFQGNYLISMLDHGFDLVLHCGQLPTSNFYYKKLGEWLKITCAAPKYFKKQGKPKTPDELNQYNCFDHSENNDHTWSYLVDGKTQTTLVNGSVRVNNSMDLKNLALSGCGIVYLPSFTVLAEIQNKTLEIVLEKFMPKPLGIYAVYPSKEFLDQKTSVLIKFLEDTLPAFDILS